MKLWHEPEIHVLARPDIREEDVVEWVEMDTFSALTTDVYGAADGLAEIAGRACYWSYGKGRKYNEEYIENIVCSGHGSVLEHPTWTFGIKGISRSLSHELVRHRHLSFSQLSQRYVTDEPEFVVPPGLPTECLPQFESACSLARTFYYDLFGRLPDRDKKGREVARAVLPNATATRIVVTGNARALRNMLALRGTIHADAEFRRLAVRWAELMKTLAPNIFADFDIISEDGVQCISTPYPKV